MKGLEASEVWLSELEYSGRIDAEYYKPYFLRYESIIKRRSATLSSISNFLIGPFGSAFTVDNYVESKEYRYIRGKDVKPLRLMDDDNVYISQKDFERLSRYALKENDILVSVVGTIGNAAIISKKDLPAIFSCKSTVLRPFSIEPKYLAVYLNTKYGKSLLQRKERGAIQKGLNLDDLKNLDIYIPDYSIQTFVKNLYDTALFRQGQSQALYRQAEELLLEALGLKDFEPSRENKSVKTFKASFLTTGRLDAEYYQPKYEEIENKIKRLPYELIGSICSDITYGTVPTSPYTENGEGIPYIKGMNLKNLRVMGDLDRITNTDELPDKFYTETGDIVISQMGTVGDVGIITEKERGYLFASFTIRIRIKDKKMFNPYYVGLYIQNIAKEWYLLRNIAQASVRQNTDLPTIRNMYIPLVETEIQRRIAALIKKSFALRRESERLLDEAKGAVEREIEGGAMT
ncbi:MAG: restriction endonuclease subunit S [Treponema sp.]|nr:restriction endonuclease subunit S [Treponema sp.]